MLYLISSKVNDIEFAVISNQEEQQHIDEA